MITSIANLLQGLMLKEAEKLDKENITHAPTIGAMYEGLTRDILERTLPASLNLRIVNGFIEGSDGTLSPQIDAMLVTGEGRALPYGTGHVWPIGDIIAVLEIKKNLFNSDLEDAFIKLHNVKMMHDKFIQSMKGPKPDVKPAFQAFARVTGIYPRTWDAADNLPNERSYIFHVLIMEQLAPVRIILGYHGYKDEFSLRKGLLKYLEKNLMTPGFGVGSLPNLIICSGNALLKMNGQPYGSNIYDDWWPIMVSNAENPLRLLIELIWTRIANHFRTAFSMDDTLQMERLAPFLSAKLAHFGDKFGWEYRREPLKRKQLLQIEPSTWKPGELDENEWVLVMAVARNGEVDTRDNEYRRYASEQNFDPNALVAGLVERRVLAWCDEHSVRLIDEDILFTGFMPDGRTVSSSNIELLSLWLGQTLGGKPSIEEPK